ncbi:MAG: multiheme c-type cytochrome [Pyrinomonadaceae bacterium]
MLRLKLAVISFTAMLLVGFCDPLLLWSRGEQKAIPANSTWRPNRPSTNGHFVGAQACAKCHADKAATYKHSSMSQALETVADCSILRKHPLLTYKLGPFTYRITREGTRSLYSVTDGVNTVTEPILHCFGQGTAGQTYMLQHAGSFYESRVSFYNDTQGLDITIGYPRTVPASLNEALGRLTGPDEVRSCYGCHSTAATNGMKLQLDSLMPGVSCEACHGPGEKHLAAMKVGNLAEKSIFNPAKLSGDELTQEFCAACHRSAEDVALMPDQAGINNVRFQPYRIFGSPCYADDKRISCTACHDPHQELKRDISSYDSKCMACHISKAILPKTQFIKAATLPAALSDENATPVATAPPCPVETANCASCHMPKVDLPGSHTKFTDHRIRVVKPGDAFPK